MINVDQENTNVTEGVWTTEFEGAQFLVSHWTSIPFQRAVQRFQAPHRRKIDNGKLDPKLMRDLMAKAMAEALIHDWRGEVVDGEGNKVEYTPAAGYRMLVNHPEIRDFISDFSMDLDNFRQEVAEEAEKS